MSEQKKRLQKIIETIRMKTKTEKNNEKKILQRDNTHLMSSYYNSKFNNEKRTKLKFNVGNRKRVFSTTIGLMSDDARWHDM